MRAVGLARPHRTVSSAIVSVALRSSLRSVSLSELAKTFAEMSESNETAASPAPEEVVPRHYRTATPKASLMENVVAASSKVSEKYTKGQKTSNVLTFSIIYSEGLSEIPGSQLTTLMESEHKRQHHGHMLQCLVEVWRRLRKAPPTEVLISEEEARGNGVGDSGGTPSPAVSSAMMSHFRSDMLLEGVLRVLAKTEMSEMLQCSDEIEKLQKEKGDMWWVTEFSHLLLQWLIVRASMLSASRSATFIHLIAQQKLFHSDAVLETLRDNIEVHLANYPLRNAAAGSSSTNGNRVVDEFDLSSFSVVLDAVARWQLGFVRLFGADSLSPSRATSGASTVVAIARIRHPILNPDFFNVVSGGLVRGIRNGSLHLTRHGSPTTFFFLTLALAKIRWFHMECIEVLLPQLHEALRVFPAQFLGTVLFLGRREVKVCNFETTDLLLQTLLDAMQKRGRRYNVTPSDAHRHHRLDGAALEVSSALLYKTTVANYGSSVTTDGNDTGDDLQLFSRESFVDPVVETSSKVHPVADMSNKEGCSHPEASFTTSFVDLRSIPLFLDSLNHILTTTLDHCHVQGRKEQWNALNAKAVLFYDVFLNDARTGVKSLRMLLERPSLVEKLLHSLLHIPQGVQHPFLIEVVYVFTRQLGARCAIKRNDSGRNSGRPAALNWQKRILGYVELLVERGLLTPGTYAMNNALICAAPRVAAALEVERARMMERNRACDEQDDHYKRKEVANGGENFHYAPCFANFSRDVKQMQKHLKST